MQDIEKDIPEDSFPHNQTDKKLDIFMNLRSIKSGPRCSFIQKRTHSQQKIQSQFHSKKRHLFDQQITHAKTMLDYNKPLTHKITGQNSKIKYATLNLGEAAWSTEMNYKKVLNQCKGKEMRLDKGERSYSETKSKQTTKCKSTMDKKIKDTPCPYYFLNSYKSMQEIVIQVRRQSTQNFVSTLRHKEDDLKTVSFCDNLWGWINGGLDFLSKFLEIDIFQRKHMVSSLKDYHRKQAKQEQKLLFQLFQDFELVKDLQLSQENTRKRRMDRMKELAQSMKIEVNSENTLDFDRMFLNFRRMRHRQYDQNEHQHIRILARVMKISQLTIASAQKLYLIEYYIGLHRAVTYKELIVLHPKQIQTLLHHL